MPIAEAYSEEEAAGWNSNFYSKPQSHSSSQHFNIPNAELWEAVGIRVAATTGNESWYVVEFLSRSIRDRVASKKMWSVVLESARSA